MVDENRFEGTARNIGGKVQDAVGGLTGDTETQARGKANQVAGRAQNLAGNAADEVRDLGQHLAAAVKDQPLTSLAIVGGIGILIGFLMRR